MVQASDLRDSDDVSITRRGRGARDKRVLRQSQMRSGLVVVDQAGARDAMQVVPIQTSLRALFGPDWGGVEPLVA